VRRMRQIIAGMLASRETDPSPGFVQLQIARLSEAMIVARTMMMHGNLQAMDRWIKLTSELDRYLASHRPKFPGEGCGGAAAPRRAGVPRDLVEPRRFPRRDRGARGPDGKTESPGNGAATT
jgi:hypothetical protein